MKKEEVETSAKYEEKYVKPIVNAARPGTLAGLSLTVLKFSTDEPIVLKLVLALGAIMFLLSSFFIFFYSIYPARRALWTGTAVTFLSGLIFSIISSIILLTLI